MDDNHEKVVDVPESDSYLPHDCYENSHDQYNCEEKPLNHKHREIKSKKIKESEHQDKKQISQNSSTIKYKIIQEYAKIMKIIKEHNRNLERIKMNRLSTMARSNLQGLGQLCSYEKDKFNEKVFKDFILQLKCPGVRWSEFFTTTSINIPKDSSGCPDRHLENKERWTAGEKEHCSYKNVSKSSNLEGSLYSFPTGPKDLFKGLLDKVNSMLTCLNDSKDLNDHIVNLLKRGRDHLKHCRRCGLSSEDYKKLEHICEELQFACNQKFEQISNENKNCDRIAPIGRISAGQASDIFNDCFSIAEQCSNSPNDECCCSMIPAPCCYKPESEPNEACCCSDQEDYNSDNKNMLYILERVASGLKDIKSRQKVKLKAPPPEQDASLSVEITSLRKRVRMLEYENAQLKYINKEQQTPANDSKEAHSNDKQTVADKIRKQNHNIPNRVQDETQETKQGFDKKDKRDSESSTLSEQERNKLKECLNEQEMLREKLTAAEESLKKLQEEVLTTTTGVNHEAEQLNAEIEAAREKSVEIEKLNADQKQDIIKLKNELNEVRKEAAALLSKAKERFEKQMAKAYDKIREQEESLAKERANNFNTLQDNERCCKELECALCKLESSQLKVKRLQACVRHLIDQIRTHKTTTCCSACEKCNKK